MSTAIVQKMAPEPTPMSLLARSVELGRPIEEFAKLLELQERWERREAEKAFVAALAAFKKNPPEIAKNRKVSYQNKQGQTVEYKHATLDRVTGAVAAGLGEHGLSADWETVQENNKIRVTCFLQHERGHREKRASLEGPPDDSGAKSPVQAIASTVTFFERYTLLSSLGLAARDDSDGITFGDVEDMLNSLASAASLEELQERYNKWFKRARMARDKAAMDLTVEAKERRKGELTNPKAIEFRALADKANLNMAARNMLLGKHNNDYEKAIEELKAIPAGRGPDTDKQVDPKPDAAVEAHGPAGTEVAPADAGQQGPKRSAKKKRGGEQAETTARPEPATSRPAEAAPPSSEEKKLNFGF